MLGVGALSLTLSIFSGFYRTWSQGVADALGHVVIDTDWRTRAELRDLVTHFPRGVQRVETFWNSQGLLVGKDGGRGVLIEGRGELAAADAAPSESTPDVQLKLGAPLAEYLGVEAGGTVRLLLPGVIERAVEARISDLVRYGMYDVDSRYALVDDASFAAWASVHDPEVFARRPGDARGLRVFFDPAVIDPLDVEKVEAWRTGFRAAIQDTEWSFETTTRTWREQRKNAFGGMDLDRQLLTIVIGLLTIVAAFNVVASLVVLFTERDREMATLVGLGLSRGAFTLWTGTLGLIMGFFSSLAGIFVGWGLGRLLQMSPLGALPAKVYNVERLPLAFVWTEQLSILGFGTLCAWLAAVILGWSLARMDILRVLGHRG